jgi:hypothetical protein
MLDDLSIWKHLFSLRFRLPNVLVVHIAQFVEELGARVALKFIRLFAPPFTCR